MKASDLFVDCLENEGVEFIFGIPGEETVDTMESLLDSKINFVLSRHEQAAAFMADAYGRLTGKAGVCLSTLGPGATNLITGIANANLDRSPVVALTAQVGREKMHKESHQYIDLVKTFYPLTKWNTSIRHPNAISEVIRKSFKIAQIEKPGAVQIEFPEDVARSNINGMPMEIKKYFSSYPNEKEIKSAANLIKESKYPIILAGNGVIRAKASKELVKFAEINQIPVANTFMSKGVLPYDNELSLGTIGLQMKDYVSYGFDKADLIITVGYDFVEYSPRQWNQNCYKKIINIDSIRSEIDTCFVPSAELIGDIPVTLQELIKATGYNKKYDHFTDIIDLIHKESQDKIDDNSMPVKPQRILSEIRNAMQKNDVLISDVGMHKLWIARFFPTYEPNTVLIPNGFSAMGFGLPAGIAAKLVDKKRNVVVVSGDGGFMMNSQEIETAKRLGISLVVIVLTDNKLSLIDYHQKNFKKKIGVDFCNPDFIKYAESFGAAGYKIEKTDDIEPILKKAIKSKDICIIDVPIDISENHTMLAKMGNIIYPI